MNNNKPSLTALTLKILNEIVRQKKWLLLPIWILLAALAILFVIGGSGYIIPAIYIAF